VLKSFLSRSQWAAITLVAACASFLLLVRLHREDHPPQPGPSPVVFELRGNLSRPGVYFANGPRLTLREALQMGGGLTEGNPPEISRELLDSEIPTGQTLHVFRNPSGEWTVRRDAMSAGARFILGEKLDINRDSEEDLTLVPGMRAHFAAAIVRRRAREPWKKVEDLAEIPGVGPKTLEKWRGYLAVPRIP